MDNEVFIGDTVKISAKVYGGAYELNQEFEVVNVLSGSGDAVIIGNDGKEVSLWDNEYVIIKRR